MWNALIQDLKSEYTCISLDLPGYSENSDLPFTNIQEIASQINDLLHEITSEKCILFGHSMGGYIALEMAQQEENKFNGLGLIHSTALEDTGQKKQNRKRAIDHLKDHSTEKYLELFIRDLVSKHNFEIHKKELIQLVQSTKKETIISCLNAMMKRTNHVEFLEQTVLPVFFAIGKEDVFLDKKSLFKQASLCQQSFVSYYKTVGHLCVFEDKKKCLTDVRHFLNFVFKNQ